MISARWRLHALEMLMVVPATRAGAGCVSGAAGTWGQTLVFLQGQFRPIV